MANAFIKAVKTLPNPREPKEFAKMIEPFKKYDLDRQIFLENLAKQYPALMDQTSRRPDWGILYYMPGINQQLADAEEYIYKAYANFPKDNQIMSFVQYIRALLAKDIVDSFENLADAENNKLMIQEAFRVNTFKDKSLTMEELTRQMQEAVTAFANEFKSYQDRFTTMLDKYEASHNADLEHDAPNEDNFTLRQILSSTYQALRHFIDVYNLDKRKYRPLMEHSWANKAPWDIVEELKKIEERLGKVDDIEFASRYNEMFVRAEETKEFLKVNDTLSWYIIHSNSCSFEGFIGSRSSKASSAPSADEMNHCGTDADANVLFSLRSKDESGRFIHHVTASAITYEARPEKKAHYLKTYYVLNQIRGRRNSIVQPNFWDALYLLCLQGAVIAQKSSEDMYRGESNFSIKWLNDEASRQGAASPEELKIKLSEKEKHHFKKLYLDFVKTKPLFFSMFEAKAEIGIFDIAPDVKNNFKRAKFSEVQSSGKPGSKLYWMDGTFESLQELLMSIADQFNSVSQQNLDYAINALENGGHELFDVTIRLADETYSIERNYEKVLKVIKKEAPISFSLLSKNVPLKQVKEFLNAILYKNNEYQANTQLDSSLEMIREALIVGIYSGYEVGTQDDFYDKLQKHFDDLDLEIDDKHVMTIMSENVPHEYKDRSGKTVKTTFKKWFIRFFLKELDETGFQEFDNKFGDHRSSLPFELTQDFSDDAFLERFSEELGDNHLKKKNPTTKVGDTLVITSLDGTKTYHYKKTKAGHIVSWEPHQFNVKRFPTKKEAMTWVNEKIGDKAKIKAKKVETKSNPTKLKQIAKDYYHGIIKGRPVLAVKHEDGEWLIQCGNPQEKDCLMMACDSLDKAKKNIEIWLRDVFNQPPMLPNPIHNPKINKFSELDVATITRIIELRAFNHLSTTEIARKLQVDEDVVKKVLIMAIKENPYADKKVSAKHADENEEDIIELYKKGISVVEVARRFDLSPVKIREILAANKVKRHEGKYPSAGLVLDDLLLLIKAKTPLEKIAKRYKVSNTTIYKFLQKHGHSYPKLRKAANDKT